jgi:phospholipid-binding lipoprotein MlaA
MPRERGAGCTRSRAPARPGAGSSPAKRARIGRLACAAVAAALVVSACASVPADRRAPDDPLEPVNRAVFGFNTALDDALIEPAAEAYRATIPAYVRDRIRSIIDNLAEPRIFVNDVLQGRFNAAGFTFARFFVNSIAGAGGMFDFAGAHGLARQSGDFGQTLDAWGAAGGPYLVLPLFGPSNVRDAFGLGVDLMTTPPALIVTGHSRNLVGAVVGVVDGIDLRARNIETLDEIRASSLDFYAHLKSIVTQHRAAELREARGLNAAPPELVDPNAPMEDPQP